MPKAIFEVTSSHEENLPPMENEDGYQLHHLVDGVLKGGYSCFSEAPQPYTLTVQVEASEAVLDMMAEDPRYFYLGDVDEDEIEPSLQDVIPVPFGDDVAYFEVDNDSKT